MKGIPYFLIFVLVLVGCGGTSEADQEGSSTEVDSGGQQEEQMGEEKGSEEVVFESSYVQPDSLDYLSPQVSFDGETIVVTMKETIKRDDDYSHYLVSDSEMVETRELSLEEPSRRCATNELTPDGLHMAFQCPVDGIDFAIYSLELGEVVYESKEQVESDYRVDLLTVTNDLRVVLETQSSDGDDQLTIFDTMTEEQTDYDISEWFGESSDSVSSIGLTYDGSEMLIDTVSQLFIFNLASEDVEQIVDLNSTFREEYEDDWIFIYSPYLSPNGRYLVYTVSGDAYSGYFFLDRETGEERVYRELDYTRQAGISNDSEVLFRETNGLYLFNYATEELKMIHDELKDNAQLSGDGNVLYYTEEIISDDNFDERDVYVKKQYLDNKESLEVVTLDAAFEEAAIEASSESLELFEKNFDEAEDIYDFWEQSRGIEFVSDIPGEIEKLSYSTGQKTFNDLTIEFQLDGENRAYNYPEIKQRVQNYEEKDYSPDRCIDEDLELIETADGIDYYFYQSLVLQVKLVFIKTVIAMKLALVR
ncbi:hypothetical protein [Bacillus sp. JCM 19041]|uniref:hypothetical protein n=1 Tax=Bacillus sp. JCM 19041 TaxID=1460637 RepID=UPI0006CF7465